MAYKVTIDMPNLTEGTEVFIDGLGTFKNGESQVVPHDRAEHFRNAHGRVNDAGEWEAGPVLSQAFAEGSGVTIERVSDDTKTAESAPKPTKQTSDEKGGSK
jgi:hypothetical protein